MEEKGPRGYDTKASSPASICSNMDAWDKPDNGGDEDASNAGPSEGSRSNSKRVRRTDNILKASVWPDLPQTLGFYHLIGSSYKL